jgi:hypothetical protein
MISGYDHCIGRARMRRARGARTILFFMLLRRACARAACTCVFVQIYETQRASYSKGDVIAIATDTRAQLYICYKKPLKKHLREGSSYIC